MAMRATGLITFLLLFSQHLLGQINESFNLLSEAWKGDRQLFTTQNGRLISNSQVPNDTFYMSIEDDQLHEQEYWKLEMQLNFRTSSANYVDFYIAADDSILEDVENALFVRIGNTADEVSLYTKTNGSQDLLIDGNDKTLDYSSTSLKVALKKTGAQWELFREIVGVDAGWISEGKMAFEIPLKWKYSGLLIRQSTSGFFGKHEFESFYAGPAIRDTLPPLLTAWRIESDSAIVLNFNEKIQAGLSNFIFSNGPDLFSVTSLHSEVKLLFKSALPFNQFMDLKIQLISDTSGNLMKDTIVQIVRTRLESAERHDILIHELMPIPEPVVGLQPYEYIELINRSSKWIQLSELEIGDLSGSKSLPDYILPPDSMVLLYPDAARGQFQPYPNTLFMASLPSLNNAGDQITLRRISDQLWIHSVSYDANSFNDAFKASGGWSLELKDVSQPCAGSENWAASISPSGGTPGLPNSVTSNIATDKAPVPVSFYFDQTKREIQITFDRQLGQEMLRQKHYYIYPNLPIEKVYFGNENRNQILISLRESPTRGTGFKLWYDSLYSCSTGWGKSDSFYFGVPVNLQKGMLFINEVLYNEAPNGSDYFELYNASDSLIDLADLRIILGRSDESVIRVLDFKDQNRLQMPPRSYLCMADDREAVKNTHLVMDEKTLITHSAGFALNTDGGYISLRLSDGSSLDSFYFYDELHHPLILETDGVSLERIGVPSSNWTSAAFTAGYGTPGYQNSQLFEVDEAFQAEMELNPNMFSPNGDGVDDLLKIGFQLEAEAKMSLKVFDLAGQEVKVLLNNESIGSTAEIIWDGRTENGNIATTGIYVVLAEGFNPSGKLYRFKKAVHITYP